MIHGVTTDSRNQTVDPAATLFVAISGTNHDGHDYIADLYRRGIRNFLVERLPESADGLYPEAGFILIPDSLRALQRWAAHHREQYTGTVVGITGSNGKTVVKEWIAQLWPGGREGKLLRSPRSYNSQLGVALSLLMIEGDERIVVIEAGISQPGEMERLERMIHPTIGLLTHIGEAHQENFESTEQKRIEKLKLFAGSSKIIYRADGSATARHIERQFAPEQLAGWQTSASDASGENRESVLALYRTLGIEPKPVSGLQPVAMRLELREGILGSTLIDDSYNSDLTSLGIALDFLSHNAGTEGRKAVVLSDIHQSHLNPEALYGKVIEMLRAHGVTDFTGIGPALSKTASLFAPIPRKRFYRTTEEFLRHTDRNDFSGMYILVKGSRDFEFERITRFLEKRSHTTTLEVNLTAMAANLNHYRALLRPGTRTMAMVKAFSYGSGSTEVAAMLQHEGVDYLGVAFADEGVALRDGGIHLPIVVLNSDPGSFAVMADYGLEPEIYSPDSLKAYTEEIRKRGITNAGIHLKIDSGMHRLGFTEEDLPELIRFLQGPGEGTVRVRSVFSHLAAADDPAEDSFTRGQIELFDRMSGRIIEALGSSDILRHICNSSGIERFPEAHFEMVRLGIGLYGTEQPGTLQVVSTLKTQIVQIKTLTEGDTVGYNRRGKVEGPMRIATIPIGYADGMNRRLSNGKGRVSVDGVLCPIIGNICMDTCMVDITAAGEVNVGDEVVIFGQSPTAKEIADSLGTISYEVLTSVSARIKRIYTRE